MNNISHSQQHHLPSIGSLVKATAVALLVAALVLIIAVLPAEYGIDPTGLGKRLGFADLSKPAAASVLPVTTTTADPTQTSSLGSLDLGPSTVWKSSAVYRTDELSLVLQPDEGAEIKATMNKDERFVFSWQANGGPVNFDMHGEEPNAASGEYTSHWKGVAALNGNGAFVAPFTGTHGWYWRNRGTTAVTIVLKTSGFYQKLARP